MASLATWIQATRPKTLAAGIVPVAVGTALAGTAVAIDWAAAAACLAGALLIQIGCNFANDAFDGLKGTDGPGRVGPQRAVAAGLITPRAMLAATALVLGLAFLLGLWLSWLGGWPVLVLGVVSIACAILYTAGPWPLAYVGLGDLFVLLFFGLFAVLGSAWVQVHPRGLGLAGWWWPVAVAVGLQATAIIAVNNLRDIATDGPAGKRTLAVRLGDRATRHYYTLLHLGAAACLLTPWLADRAVPPWLALPAGIALVGGMLLSGLVAKAQGPALNVCLARTASLEAATGAALVGACRV
ncbi:MAG: 1,4-dihydroxy-2-naphthoate polyprenyltransferase [Planctomycetes bacterium]|nr:1,4-dihydroxy-2-naphthoate polyprenyltransferase [Planctomycetota bacterium]